MTTAAVPTPADALGIEFARLLRLVDVLGSNADDEVRALLNAAVRRPLSPEEAHRALTSVLERLAARLADAGDHHGADTVRAAQDRLLAEVAAVRARLQAAHTPEANPEPNPEPERESVPDVFALSDKDGVRRGPVSPTPVFSGRPVHMYAGFVPTRSLQPWPNNERLEVHVEQLTRQKGRPPTSEELLALMQSKVSLPGLEDEIDQFKILDLARSIANNGVREAPIIDRDGTLLDGNRRLAACHLVLQSDEFTAEQRARAEWIYVWQLTEFADDEDRRVVVTSLNFEPPLKQHWPDYVRARKVAIRWRHMLELEPRPTQARLREMKKEVSQYFALGPDAKYVNRYLKMFELAEEFESFEVEERRNDPSAVKHAATRHFQYFDELSKGATTPGGVANVLGRDEPLKPHGFDELVGGEVRNWRQIRDLKYAADNSDVVDKLKEARNEPDVEEAQATVDLALSFGKASSRESRELGANVRIETFVKWLEGLPVSAFSQKIKPQNLLKLRDALRLVEPQVHAVLGSAATGAPTAGTLTGGTP